MRRFQTLRLFIANGKTPLLLSIGPGHLRSAHRTSQPRCPCNARGSFHAWRCRRKKGRKTRKTLRAQEDVFDTCICATHRRNGKNAEWLKM